MLDYKGCTIGLPPTKLICFLSGPRWSSYNEDENDDDGDDPENWLPAHQVYILTTQTSQDVLFENKLLDSFVENIAKLVFLSILS